MKYLQRGECCDALDELVELLGCETIINEINSYFSSDDVSGFVQSLASDYEVKLSVLQDEENEEDED